MLRRTTTLVAAGIILGAGVLTGCGSDDSKSSDGGKSGASYCDLLKDQKSTLDALKADSPDFKAVDEAMKKIADAAPDSVSNDWKTVSAAVSGLVQALDESGIDLQAYIAAASTGKTPEGVTPEQLKTLGEKASALQSPDLAKATQAINDNAKTDCNISLAE